MVTSPDSLQVLVPFYHLLYMLLASLAPLIQLLIKKGRERGRGGEGRRERGREGKEGREGRRERGKEGGRRKEKGHYNDQTTYSNYYRYTYMSTCVPL